MSMKNSNDTIGNRTRDLRVCVVPLNSEINLTDSHRLDIVIANLRSFIYL